MVARIPLLQEPIADMDAVIQYDKGAKLYMLPEYKYFVWKILRRGIREGKVLDIGTGSGLLAIELARVKGCQFDITAIDISQNMINLSQKNAIKYHVENRIKFLVATAANLPFDDESFDLVISYASLHHWFNPTAVFNEIGRVVKRDGIFIIRDNKRVYQHPIGKIAIWLVSRFMNKRHRENWPKALLASYTMSEIKQILKQTRLKNYRVHSDFVGIDLSIESD